MTRVGRKSVYSYDAKNRLIQNDTTGTNAHNYTFTFDSVDNRLTATDSGSFVASTFDAASRLKASVGPSGTTTFGYSLEGTQTSVQEPPGGNLCTFTQDVEYRLASATGPSGTRDWYYDADGRMQYFSGPGTQGIVTMVWDRDSYLQVRNAGTITNYSTAFGRLIGEKDNSNVQIDYIPDALGSVVMCVDANQNITFTAAYKPWGGILAWTGNQPYCTWVGTLRYLSFAGVVYAEYPAGVRIVSSTIARWTSVDPTWPRQAAYRYGLASPIVFVETHVGSPVLHSFHGKVQGGVMVGEVFPEVGITQAGVQ